MTKIHLSLDEEFYFRVVAVIGNVAVNGAILIESQYNGNGRIKMNTYVYSTGGSISNTQFLSHVTLNVISNNVCRYAFPLILSNSNICTSGLGGSSTCSGDSGGPLAVNHNGRRILVRCCDIYNGLFKGFTRIES